MKKEGQVDRVTVSETVKVNIANYESRDFFISYATDLEEGETPADAILRAKKVIRPEINKLEKRARVESKRNVDFDTMSKLRG